MKRITVIETAPSLDVFYEIRNTRGDNGAVFEVDGEVSRIRSGSKFRPALRQNPGGKGINVANVLARLLARRQDEVQVDLHLFCQEGPLTHAILQYLHADRKLAGRVSIVHHPVGVPQPRICANASITKGGRMKHEFNFSPHAGLDAPERKALLDRMEILNREREWVVVAGTPPKNGRGADGRLFCDIVGRLNRTKVLLDTSGPSLDHCLQSRPKNLAVVKINHEEARQSVEHLRRFTGLRVVTDPDGAVVHKGRKRLGEAKIERGPSVRFTLGAGDSVTAGFMLEYLKSGDPLAALHYSQAVAQTLVSSSDGIDGITPRRVERHLDRLVVE